MFRQYFVSMIIRYLASCLLKPSAIREYAAGVYVVWLKKDEADRRPWLFWDPTRWQLKEKSREFDIQIVTSPDNDALGALKFRDADITSQALARQILEIKSIAWHSVGEAIKLSEFGHLL